MGGASSAVLFAFALLGCNAATLEMQPGETYDAGIMVSDAAPDAEADVDPAAVYAATIAPLLENRCGACHEADRTGPAFLASPSYETLLGYPALVDLRDPAASRLLTKGAHAGPAWPASEAELVRDWIRMEAARTDPGEDEEDVADGATDARDIVPGLNVIELIEAAPELEGARLTFVATRTAAGVFLAELKVYAGEAGVRLRHPVLVTYRDGLPEPDPVDRFNGIEVSVGAFESAPIGSGSVSLVAFPDDAQLGFVFGSIGRNGGGGDDPEDPEDPMAPTDGCRAVGAFTAEARPQLSAFCSSCHAGGNATATSALDMTGVGSAEDAAAQRRACGQVLGVINPADPTASSVWRAPDRASDLTGHDFKFPTTTQLDDFRAALSRWLSMEE